MMKKVEITQHGEWQIATAIRGMGGFVVWGKKGKIVSKCPIDEPGDVYCKFHFGTKREDARNSLVQDLGLPPVEPVALSSRLKRAIVIGLGVVLIGAWVSGLIYLIEQALN